MIAPLLAVLVAATIAPISVAAAASNLSELETPPPGFEALLEPRRTMVDVHFGGRFIVSTMARFDHRTITFETPARVLDHLPQLRDPVRVLNELRRPLAVHAELLCPPRSEVGCGILTPDLAGVIFDESRFRAAVFINPHELLPESSDITTRLPQPNAPVSFLQNFNIVYSGSSKESDAYNFSSISTLAVRESRMASTFGYTEENDLTIDKLAFQRDRRGHQVAGGLFRTQGRALSFITERDIYGVRYASSVTTRADLALAQGLPLEVFLPLRARVEVFKDGRLIDSEYLEAGNRLLDTRRLPDGAYDVTVRIRDSTGVREEARFFVKAARLPPASKRFFQFEAGRILDRQTSDAFPTDTGHWMVRGGVTQRLGRFIGLDTGLATSGGEVIAEMGLFAQGRFYHVQGEGFASSDANRGGALTARLRVGSFTMIGDVRKSVRRHDNRFSITHEDLSQQTLSLQSGIGDGTINLSARRNRRPNETIEAQSIGYRRPLLRAGRQRIELDVDLVREDEQWLALVGIQIQLARGSWSSELVPRFRYDELDGDQETGYQFDGKLSWYDPAFRYGDLRFTLRGNSNQFQDSVGTKLNYDNRFTQTRLELDRIEVDGRELTSYVGAFNSSFLVSAHSIALGGQYGAQSAVVLDLDGEAPDTRFDVLVDDAPRGSVDPDGRASILLRPFESNGIGIRPQRGVFVDYDDRVERVTLYAGNILNLAWKISEDIVIVGRIVDEGGRPLANARVQRTITITSTDEFGMFQLETSKPEGDVVLRVQTRRKDCRIRFPVGEVREGVAIAGDLTCS
jgi:hypothetical protein